MAILSPRYFAQTVTEFMHAKRSRFTHACLPTPVHLLHPAPHEAASVPGSAAWLPQPRASNGRMLDGMPALAPRVMQAAVAGALRLLSRRRSPSSAAVISNRSQKPSPPKQTLNNDAAAHQIALHGTRPEAAPRAAMLWMSNEFPAPLPSPDPHRSSCTPTISRQLYLASRCLIHSPQWPLTETTAAG
ncbi:hypothetical protein BU16DRAFT_562285 [Lophium mytilinum]|uniref:Uncharacterized protein n=1 Tax=Lophium mytilinum TaxID=390894 RepID=A0A6A6QQE6_9PEZI|nr:hypothetical protein BU16DRAFT_562285 [Lophium mytilinum]